MSGGSRHRVLSERHNFMSETLAEAAVPQPAPVQPKAVPMLSHQAEETPKVEVPLSLIVKVKFAELAAELAGFADMAENVPSGEGLPRGKPLVKPKSRMDLYRVNRSVYNFALAALDGPFRDRDLH